MRKIRLYFETGSRAVWAFFPDLRIVWRFRPDGVAYFLQEGQYLEEPELLPGFRVPVARFFEGLSATSS